MENDKILTEIRDKLQYLDQILDLSRRIKNLLEGTHKLAPRFVESSAYRKTYLETISSFLRERFSRMTKHPEDEILIMGYFDQTMVDQLLPCAEYVRIVHPRTHGKLNKVNRDALRIIDKAGAQVRTHDELHARIFCVPTRDFLIVGSGDCDAFGMRGRHYDAGVWSNYPELVESALDFFNRVWKESDPLR